MVDNSPAPTMSISKVFVRVLMCLSIVPYNIFQLCSPCTAFDLHVRNLENMAIMSRLHRFNTGTALNTFVWQYSLVLTAPLTGYRNGLFFKLLNILHKSTDPLKIVTAFLPDGCQGARACSTLLQLVFFHFKTLKSDRDIYVIFNKRTNNFREFTVVFG